MRIVKLESELAVPELTRKLTEAGLAAHQKEKKSTTILVSMDEPVIERLAYTLADGLLTDWLYAYINGHLHEWHPYLTDDEREYVGLLTLHGLRTVSVESRTSEEWAGVICSDLSEMLEQSDLNHLHLDGVMRFRAKELLRAADVGIGEVVEQFLADREYEEFVSLLRYMLEAQPATQQVVHVFCTDERLWMCDDSGLLVTDDVVTKAAHQVSDESEVNAEDLAMSVLITRSPCRIVIHDTTNGAPWPSFSETLERVFLERAVRCSNCAACARLLHGEPLLSTESLKLWAMGDSSE